jgi:hypothetical protein
VLGITKHADLHLGTRDMRKFNGSTETFVLLWVVVLQPNLELNCLREIAFLLPCVVHDARDGLLQSLNLELTVIQKQSDVGISD